MHCAMVDEDNFLPAEATLDAIDAGALRQLPARWAVATLCDEAGRPIQLVCWKNLRRTLRGRVDDKPARVRWRRVDSDFEADWVYLHCARRLWPQTWPAIVPWIQTWFVHVDPEDEFPRYVKTTQLMRTGRTIGPFPDKHAAARFIELVEDAFDLCRYHHILTQGPNGRACPYKEMGKCPAPCDGSISMQQYHRLIDISLDGICEPKALIAEHTERMESAAGELRFETAARIKMFVAQISEFGKKAYRHARPMEEFSFVSLQPGPRQGQVKIFLIRLGYVEPVACLLGEPLGDLLDLMRGTEAAAPRREGIGLVARHLFAPKATGGEFIRLSEVDERSLRAAYNRVSRKPLPAADNSADGDCADGDDDE
jgi:hypothetical protein